MSEIPLPSNVLGVSHFVRNDDPNRTVKIYGESHRQDWGPPEEWEIARATADILKRDMASDPRVNVYMEAHPTQEDATEFTEWTMNQAARLLKRDPNFSSRVHLIDNRRNPGTFPPELYYMTGDLDTPEEARAGRNFIYEYTRPHRERYPYFDTIVKQHTYDHFMRRPEFRAPIFDENIFKAIDKARHPTVFYVGNSHRLNVRDSLRHDPAHTYLGSGFIRRGKRLS